MVRFAFSYILIYFNRVSYLLWFYSSCIPFFELHTFSTHSYPTLHPPTYPLHTHSHSPNKLNNTLTTHSPLTHTRHTQHTQSSHKLSTHTHFTHSLHTLITHSPHNRHTLIYSTHHTHHRTLATQSHTHLPYTLTHRTLTTVTTPWKQGTIS